MSHVGTPDGNVMPVALTLSAGRRSWRQPLVEASHHVYVGYVRSAKDTLRVPVPSRADSVTFYTRARVGGERGGEWGARRGAEVSVGVAVRALRSAGRRERTSLLHARKRVAATPARPVPVHARHAPKSRHLPCRQSTG